MADLYAHRSFLEGRAAQAAAHIVTHEELDQLRAAYTHMREQETPSISSYSSLDHCFHQVICATSHRDYLLLVLDRIGSAFPSMKLSYLAQTIAQELAAREAQGLEKQGGVLSVVQVTRWQRE